MSGAAAGREVRIRPYDPADRAAILEMSMRAFTPVFAGMAEGVPRFVYDSFYPAGWETRQAADLSAVLDGEGDAVDVAVLDGAPVGWVCTRLHPEDRMGEMYVLAVEPGAQRRGIGRALMAHSARRVQDAGLRMIMVETGDDDGHAAARAVYEAQGYRRWPVARYFKDLQAGADPTRGPTPARGPTT